MQRAAGRAAVLTGHSLAETYTVLTRLPRDARLTADDAARLIEASFGPALPTPAAETAALPRLLAPLGIVDGGVYDALVALGVRASGVPLLTRDARALGTYAALDVELCDA